jgi:NB-ARC domain
LGLRLGNAPQIDEEDFVGRETELEQLRGWLAPCSRRQNVVVLSGLGGMGKTQLSIQFARKFVDTFSSVFWLNAKEKSTLKGGLAGLTAQVVENHVSRDAREEEQMVQQARQWLSRPDNNRWLLVYDNYDDPRLPGISSSAGYDVRDFFPHRAQGSILITTRSPRITFGKQLRLQKLDDVDQSLAILATRSGRRIHEGEDQCECREVTMATDDGMVEYLRS